MEIIAPTGEAASLGTLFYGSANRWRQMFPTSEAVSNWMTTLFYGFAHEWKQMFPTSEAVCQTG
jgi:hypothetical protein